MTGRLHITTRLYVRRTIHRHHLNHLRLGALYSSGVNHKHFWLMPPITKCTKQLCVGQISHLPFLRRHARLSVPLFLSLCLPPSLMLCWSCRPLRPRSTYECPPPPCDEERETPVGKVYFDLSFIGLSLSQPKGDRRSSAVFPTQLEPETEPSGPLSVLPITDEYSCKGFYAKESISHSALQKSEPQFLDKFLTLSLRERQFLSLFTKASLAPPPRAVRSQTVRTFPPRAASALALIPSKERKLSLSCLMRRFLSFGS